MVISDYKDKKKKLISPKKKKSYIWKLFLFVMQMTLIFKWKIFQWISFWIGGFWKLGNSQFYSYSLSTVVFNESHAFVQVVNSPLPSPPPPQFLFSYAGLTISEDS